MIADLKTKKCKKCGKILPITDFGISTILKDGRENSCRNCRRKQAKLRHTVTCQFCGKVFNSESSKTKYCSKECAGKSRKKRVIDNCSFCGREIEVPVYKLGKFSRFYCNEKCKWEHQRELLAGELNPNYNRVKHNCDGCGKEILITPSKKITQRYIFCSNDCYRQNIGKYFSGKNNSFFKEEQEAVCIECGKTFKRKPGQFKSENYYCSVRCYRKAPKPYRKIERLKRKCTHCGKEFEILKSQTISKKHLYCSRECVNLGQGKIYHGEYHPSYNPEISDEERVNNRKFYEYIAWRRSVYERDNYTCQICGNSQGGNLIAHHLDSYRSNEEQRTDLDNGITLCEDCHKAFHGLFGYGNNSKRQFSEFLQIKEQYSN